LNELEKKLKGNKQWLSAFLDAPSDTENKLGQLQVLETDAPHGHTAAEIVHARADATKPFMGMQSTRPGGVVRQQDAAIAKNYLTEPEWQVLNRIVSLYIEYAELQALERRARRARSSRRPTPVGQVAAAQASAKLAACSASRSRSPGPRRRAPRCAPACPPRSPFHVGSQARAVVKRSTFCEPTQEATFASGRHCSERRFREPAHSRR